MDLSKQCFIDVISPDVFSVNCLKYFSLSDLCHLRVVSKKLMQLCDHHMYLKLVQYDCSLIPSTLNGRFVWELYQMLKQVKSELVKTKCFKYDKKKQTINPFEWLPVDLMIIRRKGQRNLRMSLFDSQRYPYQTSVGYQCEIRTSMIPSFVHQLNLDRDDNSKLTLVIDGDRKYTDRQPQIERKLRNLICECPLKDVNGNNDVLNMDHLPKDLRSVVFVGNGIKKIDGLNQISDSLQRLTVCHNDLKYELKELRFKQSEKSKLRDINFYRNKLSGSMDMWSFRSLPLNLEFLDLGGNEGITGVLDFKLLPSSLKELHISHCNLSGIQNISHLSVDFERLDVSKNSIKMDIDMLAKDIPKESNFSYFNCAENEMFGELRLNHWPQNLRELNVSSNPIKFVAAGGLPYLCHLDVSYCHGCLQKKEKDNVINSN